MSRCTSLSKTTALMALLLAVAHSAPPLLAQPAPPLDDTATGAAAAETVGGGAGRLDLELDRQEITVGDRVSARLTLSWLGPDPTSQPRFPTWQDTWGSAEVLEHGPVSASVDDTGRRIYRQELVLTAFETGEVELPQVTVAIPLEERTVELTSPEETGFGVVSVLPAEEDAEETAAGEPAIGEPNAGVPAAGDETGEPGELEPRPAAPPVDLDHTAPFPWVALILATLALAAGHQLGRRLDQLPAAGAAAPAKPLLPPLEELEKTLAEIDPRGPSEPVHTALSLALRRYLGRRLRFQAVESTTSEIQRQLHALPLPGDEIRRLVKLLRDCDLVKFAPRQLREAAGDAAHRRLLEGRQLAQQIEGHFAPRTVSEPDEPGATAREVAA